MAEWAAGPRGAGAESLLRSRLRSSLEVTTRRWLGPGGCAGEAAGRSGRGPCGHPSPRSLLPRRFPQPEARSDHTTPTGFVRETSQKHRNLITRRPGFTILSCWPGPWSQQGMALTATPSKGQGGSLPSSVGLCSCPAAVSTSVPTTRAQLWRRQAPSLGPVLFYFRNSPSLPSQSSPGGAVCKLPSWQNTQNSWWKSAFLQIIKVPLCPGRRDRLTGSALTPQVPEASAALGVSLRAVPLEPARFQLTSPAAFPQPSRFPLLPGPPHRPAEANAPFQWQYRRFL